MECAYQQKREIAEVTKRDLKRKIREYEGLINSYWGQNSKLQEENNRINFHLALYRYALLVCALALLLSICN